MHRFYEHYSAFEPAINALFLAPDDLMAIIAPDPFTLYCDASGKEDDPLFVVAGAIGTVEGWKAFDRDRKLALSDNELAYFRMSEFAQSSGEFAEGWRGHEDRRRAFLNRLIGIIVASVQCWIGAAVFRRDYDKADQVYELREYLQPYPLCGVTCIEMAHTWMQANHVEYLNIEYVFESGDEHSGQLFRLTKEYFGKEPFFRTKLQATPLHLADFAAYEIRKAYGALDEESEELFGRFRTSFSLLSDITHRWGNLGEVAIRTGLNIRGVAKRK